MPKKPFKFISNFINDETIKSTQSAIKKVLFVIFLISSVFLYSISLLFFILGITVFPPLFAFSIFLFIPALFLSIITYKLKQYSNLVFNNKHMTDFKVCRQILQKVKDFINNEAINKKDLIYILKSMRTQFKDAKIILKKINRIIKLRRDPENRIKNIEDRINEENNKELKDEHLIKMLKEQKENILKVEKREKMLREQLSTIRLNFNSIYTKLTLLDTKDEKNFDAIETEIQKMLNYKLKVSEFEDELDKELT